MSAARFAPTPPCGQPSSTMTTRFVFSTDLTIVSRSSGRSVRGSITSASISCSDRELLGGLLRGERHARDADDRHVVALAADRGLAEVGDEVLVLGHVAALPVEVLVLDEDHGVVVADRRLEQPLRVLRRRRHRDEQAGDVEVQRLPRVRVRRPELVAGALRHPDDHRHADLPAEHVVDRRRVVDDLVHRQQREVDRHELDDRAHARHRRADAHPDDRVLGDRRVADALVAELLEQPVRDLERPVEDADVLAHDEDVLVALHLLAERGVEGLAVAHDGHYSSPPSSSSSGGSASDSSTGSRRRSRCPSSRAASPSRRGPRRARRACRPCPSRPRPCARPRRARRRSTSP